MKFNSDLLRGVISVPRLNSELFLLRRHVQLVISRPRIFVRRVTQAVLIAQFLFNLRVNLIDGFFLRDLKQSSPGLFRDLFQYCFTVNPLFLRTSAASTPSRPKRPHRNRAAVPKSLVILEQNRIHHRICSLRRFDRRRYALFAAMINTIRKNDQRFAPLLLAHQIVARQIYRIVEHCSTTPVSRISATSAPTTASPAAADSSATDPASTNSPALASSATLSTAARIRIHLRRLQRLQRRLQFRPGTSEVLQQLHFPVEVNHKRQIFIFTQQVIQKAIARTSLFLQHAPLAQTRIHQQSQPQWQIILARKVVDSLRPPVFVYGKILFRQVRTNLSMLVAHRHRHTDSSHIHRNLGRASLLRLGLRLRFLSLRRLLGSLLISLLRFSGDLLSRLCRARN